MLSPEGSMSIAYRRRLDTKQTTILIPAALLVAGLSLVIACAGTLELQIDTAPAAEATIAALEQERSRLIPEVAHQRTELGFLCPPASSPAQWQCGKYLRGWACFCSPISSSKTE